MTTPEHDELQRWLAAVAEIGAAVSRLEPLGDLLNRVAGTACALLGYDFCGVFLPDPARDALIIWGWSGLSTEYVEQINAAHPVLLSRRGDGEAPTSRSFRTGEIVTIEDVADEPQFGPWGGVAQQQGYRALVSMPLRRDGQVVGALNCYRRAPHRFDAVELELLGTLAAQVAIALVTAQLREREQATIVELTQLNSSLLAQHAVLRKAGEIHDGLTATALRGEGIVGVVSALSRLLGREVLADDPQGLVLGRSAVGRLEGQPGADAVLPGGSLVEVTGADGSMVVVTGVVLGGEVVARLWVDAPLGDLSDLDVRATQHAGVVAALELLRERTAAEVEQRLRGSLIADLLDGGSLDVEPAVARARRMGYDLTAPRALLVIGLQESGHAARLPATEQAFAATTRLLEQYEPRPLVAEHRGLVLLLWPQDAVRRVSTSPVSTGASALKAAARPGAVPTSAAAAASQLVDALQRAPSIAAVHVAVSAPDVQLGGLPAAFRMARGALALAAASAQSRVVDLSDTGLESLLLQLDDPAGLREFARRVLGPVLDYDRDRATELVHTLRVLVENDLDRRAAAAVLHVHPNTVLQRTRRAEELTGLTLSRPRDLLQLTTALTVARIGGTRASDPRSGGKSSLS